MLKRETLEVQQGVWIDEEWIRNAGLGQHLQVVIRPGEICILPIPAEADNGSVSEAGWHVFRTLGDDAEPGQLPNAAADHDRYLYGKTE